MPLRSTTPNIYNDEGDVNTKLFMLQVYRLYDGETKF
jgi:hypothetical protein